MQARNVFAYARVSTDKQDLYSQVSMLNEYIRLHHASEIPEMHLKQQGEDYVVEVLPPQWCVEQLSGFKYAWDSDKRLLGPLISRCKEGDIVLFTELSRAGRNNWDVHRLCQTCLQKKIVLVFIKNNWKLINDDVQTYSMLFALSIAARLERDAISFRTKAGLQRARENGKKLGGSLPGPRKSTLDEHKEALLEMRKNGASMRDMGKEFSVSASAVSRYLKKRKLQ